MYSFHTPARRRGQWTLLSCLCAWWTWCVVMVVSKHLQAGLVAHICDSEQTILNMSSYPLHDTSNLVKARYCRLPTSRRYVVGSESYVPEQRVSLGEDAIGVPMGFASVIPCLWNRSMIYFLWDKWSPAKVHTSLTPRK